MMTYQFYSEIQHSKDLDSEIVGYKATLKEYEGHIDRLIELDEENKKNMSLIIVEKQGIIENLQKENNDLLMTKEKLEDELSKK